jgi:hypothetical protein
MTILSISNAVITILLYALLAGIAAFSVIFM